jgi:C_GCAxxG_C_C family probable redox protein
LKASERVKVLYLEEGYNCAESIWLALNETDLEENKLNFGMKLASVFGGGLGCGSTCGVIGGAVLTIGRWLGRDIGEAPNPELPKYADAFCGWFTENFGSRNCCDLKLENDHKPTCAKMLADTVEYIEQLLDEGLVEQGDECSL